MATSGNEVIRVMVIGERGAGKSTIANQLFGFHGNNDEERFPEHGDPAAVPATGCQYLRKDGCIFSAETTYRWVHVVEARGFLGEGVTSPQKNWEDIIKAFEFLKREVNVFLLVLKVNNPENSQTVTRALVDFFGAKAGLNTMVLFTHNENSHKTTANRFAMFHHGPYLKQLLGEDVPYHVLPTNDGAEFPRLEILHLMSMIQSDMSVYNLCWFKEAQRKYLQTWAEEMRRHGHEIVKRRDRYTITDVPQVLLLFGRYYTEIELNEIFP